MDGRLLTSWNDAVEIVRKDHSYNFIAMAVTQWNALSIDALLFYMESKGVHVRALIVIAEHYANGYLIEESVFTNKCATYYRLPYRKNAHDIERKTTGGRLKRDMHYYASVFSPRLWFARRNVLYYSTFNHTMPNAVIIDQLGDMGRPVMVCHTEEGIGPYMGTFDKTYPKLRDVNSLPGLHGYMRAVFWGRTVYRMLHPSFDSLTLHKTTGGLRANKKILPYYRKVFALRNEMVDISVDKKLIETSVIICTASWKRPLIEDEEDVRVLRDVCDYLHGKGISLLLKPHPRDAFYPTKLEELHCQMLSVPGLTMESICQYARPLAIISFASTTLINPSLFWNIPTYCVTDMLNRNKMTAYLDEIDSFKHIFKRFVRFVESPAQIEL